MNYWKWLVTGFSNFLRKSLGRVMSSGKVKLYAYYMMDLNVNYNVIPGIPLINVRAIEKFLYESFTV